MNKYILFQNGKKIDEFYNSDEPIGALSDWLNNNGFEGYYELIEKQENGSFLGVIDSQRFEIYCEY